jgi:hypothetical protein
MVDDCIVDCILLFYFYSFYYYNNTNACTVSPCLRLSDTGVTTQTQTSLDDSRFDLI